MKLYLASYKLGSESEYLSTFCQDVGKKLAIIPNALDGLSSKHLHNFDCSNSFLNEFARLGFEAEILNLTDYFDDNEKLAKQMLNFDAVWVCDGDIVVLEQAMKLSGFDFVLTQQLAIRENFLYSSAGAGSEILGPDIAYSSIGGATNDNPSEGIIEGLSIIDFTLITRFKSANPRFAKDAKEKINFCVENKILFLALGDDEVIIEK